MKICITIGGKLHCFDAIIHFRRQNQQHGNTEH